MRRGGSKVKLLLGLLFVVAVVTIAVITLLVAHCHKLARGDEKDKGSTGLEVSKMENKTNETQWRSRDDKRGRFHDLLLYTMK